MWPSINQLIFICIIYETFCASNHRSAQITILYCRFLLCLKMDQPHDKLQLIVISQYFSLLDAMI